MPKTYSRKERERVQLFKKIAICLVAMAILLGGLITVAYVTVGNKVYTEAELLHDHDGDGVPDH